MDISIETIDTGAFTMRFLRFGKGERTMVILPGLSVQSVMCAAEAVAEAYAALTEDFTIYLFDRRSELPAVYAVPEMAEDTARALQALGLRQVYLFGASQGGMIALSMAIEHPDLVRKLILGSTAGRVQEERYRTITEWVRLAEEKDRVGLYLSFGEKIYPPTVFQQYREALIAAGETVTDGELARFVTLAQGMRGFDVLPELRRLQCPVLVLGAEDDGVLGASAAMEIVEQLKDRPDFAYHIYSGYGHAAFDTAPDYKERISRFFLG